MDDKGSYYTRALAALGLPPYKAESEPGQACEQFGQVALGLAYEYCAWSFAQRRVVLTTGDGGAAGLPDDCLRVSSCTLEAYELVGRELVSRCGAREFELVYTTDVYIQRVALPDGQPMFCEACVLLLAGLIAPRVTDDVRLAEVFHQRGMMLLAEARLKDAQQVNMQGRGFADRFLGRREG